MNKTAQVIDPIGVIHSCFTEKFGIPRQPGLVTEARASLMLYPPYNDVNTIRGLEAFSHIWVIFLFHGNESGKWRPLVRPPRLGGNKRVGVFASRSCFRPNPIGMSAVGLESISIEKGHVWLQLTGVDFLDQTPVIDIKPYIPYSDQLPNAKDGYAAMPETHKLIVCFSEAAELDATQKEKEGYPHFRKLIREIIENDPRPGYYTSDQDGKTFGMTLSHTNVRWQVKGDRALVLSITPMQGKP